MLVITCKSKRMIQEEYPGYDVIKVEGGFRLFWNVRKFKRIMGR